jgi:membrane protease YdiL (CAAX protease family)
VVGFVCSNLLAGIWLSASGAEELSLGGMALGQVGLWVGLIGAPLVASRYKGSGRLSVDFGLRARPIDAAIGFGGGLAAQFVLLPIIALLLSPFVGHPDVSGQARELSDKADGIGVVALVIAIVVVTPVAEELFFRGLLLRSLARRWGTGWAIGLSSVLFGVSHLRAASAAVLLVTIVSLTAFGALLAVLAVRTGRLGSAILAHALFNGWTLLVVLVIKP